MVLALISAGFLGLLAISSGGLVEPAEAENTRAFAGGDGSIGDPYQIANVTQLQNISSDISAHYILTNDIDASATVGWNAGEGFEPIGELWNGFTGSLDGQGCNITDLFINLIATNYVGLFGVLEAEANLNNIGLHDINISGNYYAGGLAGRNYGTVENCYATGNVSGNSDMGGILGSNDGTVSNCHSTGNVNGAGDLGSLMGYNQGDGSVSNCSASGNVSGTRGYIGGLIGGSDGLVSNCSASGNVRGEYVVGGLVGDNGGLVSNCSASGDVSCTDYDVGGLIATVQRGSVENCSASGNVIGGDYVGGLFGEVTSGGAASNCYATGSVSGADYVGGFMGYIWNCITISNSYATGSVNGANFTGGFMGHNVDSSTISNCYATGNVTGTDLYIGGFTGFTDSTSTAENCFWDTETSGMATSDGGTGKTTAEMKTKSTFTNATWDLDLVWDIVEDHSYPFLRDIPYTSPQITSSDTALAIEDSPYSVAYSAEVFLPDSTYVSWSMQTNAGTWLSMTAEGVLSGTPLNEDVGEFWVEITADDGREGNDTVRSLTLTVQNTNDAPEINFTILNATEDAIYSMPLSAIDVDPTGDTLTWALESGPTWLELNTTTNTLMGTPRNIDVGINEVNVSVDDGNGGSDWQNFTIVVLNTNDDPIIIITPLNTTLQDELYSIFLDATDEDPVAIDLTWSMDTNADWLELNGTYLNGTPGNSDVGTFWVNIKVLDDQGGSDSLNFTLTVNNTNDAPVIETRSLPNATEDVAYEFNLTATDVDAGDILNWTLVFGPDWIELNGSRLEGTPDNDDVGIFWVNITVTDGYGGSHSLNYTLMVIDVNDIPVWSLTPTDQDLTEGEELTLECTATDIDGDIITYSIETTPTSDITIDSGTGVISWTSPVVGTYTVTVTASDGTVEIHHTFSIVVKAIPDDNLTDTDGDGMPDSWELEHGLDPDDPTDAALDSDGDGISNLDEYKQETDPNVDGSTDTEDKESNIGLYLIAGIALLLIMVVIIVLVVKSRKCQTDSLEE